MNSSVATALLCPFRAIGAQYLDSDMEHFELLEETQRKIGCFSTPCGLWLGSGCAFAFVAVNLRKEGE